MASPSAPERRAPPAGDIATAGVAMVVFALVAHQGWPWIAASAAGLLVTAAAVGISLRNAPDPLALLGLEDVSRRAGLIAILGIILGAVAGMAHRNRAGVIPDPGDGLHLFVLLACLIGAAEELLYRGWLQGRASALGAPAAVTIGALGHAAYKTALFVWPPDAVATAFDLRAIALLTAVGGVVLGVLRVASGSVLPPILAHVAFDAVVYSAHSRPPWWVWG